jgi:hypothetical protein
VGIPAKDVISLYDRYQYNYNAGVFFINAFVTGSENI